MTGYTKLFGSILESTVWLETPPIKVVWITMLAMADRDGRVEASVPGLAKRAGVERIYCEQALGVFLAPDPDSRTKTHEGRRIEEIPGGWRLLNYEMYRERASAEEFRQKATARKRRQRERQAVTRQSRSSVKVTESHDIAEAYKEREDAAPGVTEDGDGEEGPEGTLFNASLPAAGLVQHAREGGSRLDDSFMKFWAAYPRKVGKAAARKVWQRIKPNAALTGQILAAVVDQQSCEQWQKDGGQFIPHPTTWLNAGRWDDEVAGNVRPHFTASRPSGCAHQPPCESDVAHTKKRNAEMRREPAEGIPF